ncbi:GATA-type transcription factor sreA [Psilocybe cubensis]|uniref:GATA-type domain-containing protein n=2 Tax=Psilocybe cubensis TaxID=181762 RepID=A0A8H8CET6_PSICU|nr:GATA-type transcription factor sreA [Psilocybe cubensis]KAH9479903.1 GATA-type transcription factor sreA [Psilocybe cubensis]
MSPVVLESPALNLHNTNMSTMARIQQQFTQNGGATSEAGPGQSSSSPNGQSGQEEFNFSANVITPSRTSCSNCGVTDSPLWRRDPSGNTVCNACDPACQFCFGC